MGLVDPLAEPQSIVVVNLIAGTYERYDVPGFNQTAIWTPDGDQLLTATEGGFGGRLRNLDDGTLSDVDRAARLTPLRSGPLRT